VASTDLVIDTGHPVNELFHPGNHQLAMKPRDSCGLREHCLRYSVFYCTVCVTEAELLAMFESP
jgi:hypothetical protein